MLLRPFLVPLLLATALPAATRAPNFDAALASAQASGGHVFAYYHGSDWCRLGEAVKTKVWDDPGLAAALDERAVLVPIDQRDGGKALIDPANAKAGKITRYPGVAAFDAEGRRIGSVEGLGLDTTSETLATALAALESTARERDELFVRAETVQGAARAELLARGLAIMRKQNGFPWVDEKRGNPSRAKVLEAILAADPDDNDGWHRFLSFNAGTLAREANDLIKEQKFAEALTKLDAQIKHPLNMHLEPEQLQDLQVRKFHLFRQWKEREEDRFDVMEEIAKLDPTTHTGIGATGFLLMHGRGPASLTHGWLPKHLRIGCFQLVLTHGVAREFDHPGPYRLTISAGKGADPLTIKSIHLLVDGKEVSTANPATTLQAGQLTRAECQLDLPVDPAGRTLTLRLDCEAPADTDSSGTFSVKPLLR